jgi:NitT/TauT family transport system substrate-binding protein
MELTMRKRFKFRRSLALAVGLPLLLVGCGDGSTGEEGSSAPDSSVSEVTDVTVGLLPISSVAPVYLGIKKGFFKEHGLNVTVQTAATGTAIAATVISGQANFGFSAYTSVFQANEQGIPLRVVAQANQAGPGDSLRYEAIIVKADSDIASVKDLEGKTLAVNALKSVGSTLVTASLKKQGVDVSKVKFTEMPFPDINAAVESGRVDAAYQTEPFLTAGQESGLKVLQYMYEELADSIWMAAYFTSQDYAKSHPDVVKRFRQAVDKSQSYASEHEDEARTVIGEYTKIPPALIQKIMLPSWNPSMDLSADALKVMVDASLADGVVKSPPKLDEIFIR